MASKDKIVAYFDFDGTLSTKDTFIPFIIYCLGYWGFLRKVPQLLRVAGFYALKLIDNQEAKQRALTITLHNWPLVALEAKARAFAYSHLNKYLKAPIYAKLEWHREQGHRLVVVSANLAIYLRYFASLHQLDEVIATEIEQVEQRVSGKLATKNCYGYEKVLRIKDYLLKNNLNFEYSYAYGNSRGDHEMLDFVDEPYYVVGDEFEPAPGQHPACTGSPCRTGSPGGPRIKNQ